MAHGTPMMGVEMGMAALLAEEFLWCTELTNHCPRGGGGGEGKPGFSLGGARGRGWSHSTGVAQVSERAILTRLGTCHPLG